MDETIIKTKKPPVMPVLRAAEKFEKISFPLGRSSVVRATIQILVNDLSREYKTRKNKVEKTIEVIRIK